MPESLAVSLDGIRRVVRALRVAAAGVEAATGLTSAQLYVLQVVCRQPGYSITEVAARTLTDRTSVAAVVDRLVERGLVVRHRSGRDLRRVELHPTARAVRVLARSPHPPTRRLLDGLRALSDRDVQRLAGGLGALVAAMGLKEEPVTMLFDEMPAKRGARRARHRRQRRSA